MNTNTMKKQRMYIKNNIKNIIFMAAAVVLAAGFAAAAADSGNKKNEKININNAAVQTKEDKKEVASTTTTTAAIPVYKDGIPEFSCAKIEFSDGTVIFQLSDGEYMIKDQQDNPLKSVSVKDDNENEINISAESGELFFKADGENVESFVYSGHSIELKDNVLYYDKSPVTYEDTAFSAYRLTDKYTIECTSVGKYIIRKSYGKTTKTCNIKDDSGNELTINASSYGFEAVNTDDLLELAVKLNGDLLVTNNGKLFINGSELVPPGYNDIKVNTTTTTVKTTTTTTTKAESDESSENDEKKTETTETEDSASATPLSPSDPPKQYGSVNTSNSGASELTLEMLGYVNEVRKQYGLNEVYGLELLESAAKVRADELVMSYSHTRPDGTNFDTAIDSTGISWWNCAENIASTTNTDAGAKEIFDAWMNSEGHRANILNADMKYMAVVKTVSGTGENAKAYWEQLFVNDQYVP